MEDSLLVALRQSVYVGGRGDRSNSKDVRCRGQVMKREFKVEATEDDEDGIETATDAGKRRGLSVG